MCARERDRETTSQQTVADPLRTYSTRPPGLYCTAWMEEDVRPHVRTAPEQNSRLDTRGECERVFAGADDADDDDETGTDTEGRKLTNPRRRELGGELANVRDVLTNYKPGQTDEREV